MIIVILIVAPIAHARRRTRLKRIITDESEATISGLHQVLDPAED
ncbi:MAG: hypothetical protein ACR2QG_09740 [Gammaproteobacteria bacterium]